MNRVCPIEALVTAAKLLHDVRNPRHVGPTPRTIGLDSRAVSALNDAGQPQARRRWTRDLHRAVGT